MAVLPQSDGDALVVAGASGPLQVAGLDFRDRTLQAGEDITAMCTLARGNSDPLLAIGFYDGTLCIRDTETGEEHLVLEGHATSITAMCAVPQPDGSRLLATGGLGCTVRIWDIGMASGTMETDDWHDLAVTAMCVLPLSDRAVLATSGYLGPVQLRTMATGEEVDRIPDAGREITTLHAVPTNDGSAVLAVGTVTPNGEALINIYDPATREAPLDLVHGIGEISVMSVISRPDGTVLLATTTGERIIDLWDLTREREEHLWDLGKDKSAASGVSAMCGLPGPGGAMYLATGHVDGTIVVREPSSRTTRRALIGHTDSISAMCALPQPQVPTLLATGSDDRTVRIWDPSTGACHSIMRGHTSTITAMCALPRDGGSPLLVTCSYDRTIRIWDTLRHRSLVVPVHHPAAALAWTGDFLAVGLTAGILAIRFAPVIEYGSSTTLVS
ncbi:WD40 repeat domain-containing protein [Streptosporangium sp. KLBMP 9127]|nr:WD40 repeat domain-containing protein [Streptosporangium sp. KLBMP 9127]